MIMNQFLDPKRRASEFDPSLLPQIASSKFFKDDPSLYFNFILSISRLFILFSSKSCSTHHTCTSKFLLIKLSDLSLYRLHQFEYNMLLMYYELVYSVKL